MRIDPRSLVKKLTPTARQALESAVARAVECAHHEVTAEHLAWALVHQERGDVPVLLSAASCDVLRARARAETALATLRRGSGARPTLGEGLLGWLEEAWLYASLERGETSLRTGALLVRLAADRGRLTSEPYEALAPLADAGALRDAWATSSEESEAAPRVVGAVSETRADDAPLTRFTTSFTEAARAGRIDPVIGRDGEVRQVIDVLCRRRKNNPILVGEPGVGKTALVEGLALAIVRGEVPDALVGVDVRSLDLGALEAGASVKGEFENRLRGVIQAVQASSTPIVLFVDEAHMLVGAGNQKGGADAANLLKPALARGELRTIAATTWSEYKRYFEKDPALERRFQPVRVEEPGEDDAIAMLRGVAATYEAAHGVRVRDEAIVAAVQLSRRYVAGRQLPDKCVDLIDTTAARVRVERSTRPAKIAAIEQRLEALSRERDARSRDAREDGGGETEAITAVKRSIAELEGQRSELVARWAAERDALERLMSARRRVEAADRAGEGAEQDTERACARAALDAAHEALRVAAGDEPLLAIDVDADAVARTVEAWTGVPVGAMRRGTLDAVLGLHARLAERVLGQDEALRIVSERLRVSHAGLRASQGPVGVFLLVGPSGVGKTETAHALAELLYGGERFLTVVNMSELGERHSTSRLVGSPPGYVGYGEGGKLTEAVRQRPYSVVLLDECEKAHPDVMDLFYRLFDEGTLNDGEDRSIDFRNTLILLTSNLGSDEVVRMHERCAREGAQPPSAEQIEEAIRPALSARLKPALLHRMTVVPYTPLSDETRARIVDVELARAVSKVRDVHGTELSFAPDVAATFARRGTDIQGGVRHVRQLLEREVLLPVATELLAAAAGGARLGSIEVALDGDGRVRVTAGA